MGQGSAKRMTELTQESLQSSMDDWIALYREQTAEGKIASYIPDLSKADPRSLGIVIIGNNGMTIRAGDVDQLFTIQSISKVFAFIVACMELGVDSVLNRVDVEPTGEPFNSIMHLELNKPFNPLVNSGAITITSMLEGKTPDEKLNSILNLFEKVLGYRPKVDMEVYKSERDSASRNRAIAYFLLESGLLDSDLDITLETYFRQCSILISVEDLAKLGRLLANDGLDQTTGEEVIPKQISRLAKVLMLTCGMYDASGKFAATVGVPAKSGVSGGIMVSVPPRVREDKLPFLEGCGIGVYGPSLDKEGNSYAGIRLLRHIASEWDLSAF